MDIIKCNIDGIIVINPKQFIDERGFFCETFRKEAYKEIGVNVQFVQDNHSRSNKNVLRGLHYAKFRPQAQLLTVIHGRIYDVVVDLRRDSITFGVWAGFHLGEGSAKQIYMPPGFAHGFCVTSDYADLHYKVSEYYSPENEGGIIWNDPDLQIDWPIACPLVSEKDQNNIFFKKLI